MPVTPRTLAADPAAGEQPPAAASQLLFDAMQKMKEAEALLGVHWAAHPLITNPAIVAIALARDNAGVQSNHVVCRHKVPSGAESWAYSDRGPWRPLAELPRACRTLRFF